MTNDTRTYRPCVGIMLLNAENKVWVGCRVDIPNDAEGDWTGWSQMPQGGIDAGEDPAAAAVRELYEETSVTSATIIAEAPDWYNYDFPAEIARSGISNKYRGQTQKWFAMRFTGEESEINIEAPTGHKAEFSDWRWVAMSELVDLIVPFKKGVYTQVVDAFADLAP